MKISVSISPIWHEYGLTELEIYQALYDCGFRYADYDFSPDNASAHWLKTTPQNFGHSFSQQLTDLGIPPVSAHISGFNPLDGEESFCAISHAVQCAAAMNLPTVVIPLGTRPHNTRREYEQANLAYLRRLLPIAENAGITLLLEHSGSWLLPHYTHHAIELNRLMEQLNCPSALRINLNIAHLCVADIRPYPEIMLLKDAIRHVDASDNFGSMPIAVHPEREMLGFAPLMGYADYDQIMQGLCDVRYEGFFNLRMNMPRVFDRTSPHPVPNKLPCMPQTLTARLHTWSLHSCEHILRTYHRLDA